jgi:GH18 family chitinase
LQAFGGEYLVGATLSGYPQVVDQAYDVAGLSQALDLLNIMTYDLHGFWDARAAHHSPLYAADPSSQSVVNQGDSACREMLYTVQGLIIPPPPE